MSAVAAAILVSAGVGYAASQRGAQSQSDAANSANAVSMAQYNQTRADNAPMLASRDAATAQLNQQMPTLNKQFGMSDFQADPGYQFRMSEGTKAIERSAAAKGGLNSGATMKSLDQYSQGLGSQEYANAFDRYNTQNTNTYNRLAGMAGLGQAATNQTSAAGMNMANNVGQNMMGAANAQAAGTMGGANAVTNGMSTWMNYNNNQQMMNRFAPVGSPSAPMAPYQPQVAQSYSSPTFGTIGGD